MFIKSSQKSTSRFGKASHRKNSWIEEAILSAEEEDVDDDFSFRKGSNLNQAKYLNDKPDQVESYKCETEADEARSTGEESLETVEDFELIESHDRVKNYLNIPLPLPVSEKVSITPSEEPSESR